MAINDDSLLLKRKPGLGVPVSDMPAPTGGAPAPMLSRRAALDASAAANPSSVPNTAPTYRPQFKQVTEARPMTVRDINPKTGAPFAGYGYQPGVDKGQVYAARSVLTNPRPAAAAPAAVVAAPGAPPAAAPGPAPALNVGGGKPPVTWIDPPAPKSASYFIGNNGVRRDIAADGSVAPAGGAGGISAAAAATPMLARAAPAIAAPAPTAAPAVMLNRQRADLSGAEAERKALLGEVDSALFGLGTLNSRGKRQLFAQLMEQKGQLTGRRFDQATGFATQGAELGAGAAEQQAALAAQAAQGDADRSLQAGTSNQELMLRRGAVSQVLTGADGTASAIRGDGTVNTVRGEDGQPIRQAVPAAAGAITPEVQFKALQERLAALDADFAMPAEEKAAARAQLEAQQQALLPGGAPAAGGAPAGYTLVGRKDGKPVYRDANGQTFLGE